MSAKKSSSLIKTYDAMCRYGDLRHNINVDLFDKAKFQSLSLGEQKTLLLECLDHNHLYVNLDDIDDKTYSIKDEDRKLNRNFYGVE